MSWTDFWVEQWWKTKFILRLWFATTLVLCSIIACGSLGVSGGLVTWQDIAPLLLVAPIVVTVSMCVLWFFPREGRP